ncbi:MAG TPA: SDR family NAD(P)-dependent oxidoreductase [Thermoanaerobaculia bacterium]
MKQGIAIVGMACRYAGARSPAELWENVLAGRREFRRIPAERLRIEDYLSDPSDPDSLYSTEAAVLEGWEFDRVRFRVAGSTYRSADLAHWLALDVAAQALADAGFPEAEGLPRDAAGVLLGNSLTGEFSRANLMRLRWPYVQRMLAGSLQREGWDGERIEGFLRGLEEEYKAPFPPTTEESLAGGLSNTIAGRICNHFDLHGGGYTLDGACASSLLATANACSALAAGDLDAALAGGVDLSLDPFELVGFARTGALAAGDMRVFDARATGFIPGEGCGFVVLMREEQAVRRGCRIYAVIRGWGISSDGSGGISRPEPEGQKLALQRAYRRAGFGAGTVGYFEGHGTGTAVGDAAELEALSGVLEKKTTPPPIGSVKANIGHTKAAAGVAGLIKAALAVHHQILPPNAGCEEPHPILRERSALRTLERGEVWPADAPLRAAVSAMGFGGINSHVVLEGTGGMRRRAASPRERVLLSSAQDAELLLLAAPDADGLAGQAERLLTLAPRISRSELADLAAALHARLQPGPVRAAVVASSPRELAERLERLLGWLRDDPRKREAARLEPRHGVFLGIGGRGSQPWRVGFLFPGQGSPSHLGRGGALTRRFEALDGLYDLAGLPADADPVDTAVAQPAILAHSLAGLALLERIGVQASVAVGHSLGEIAALCWASAFDEETAVRLAAARGQAMSELGSRHGAMAGVSAGPGAVEELLTGTGAVIAAFNAPGRTVISGEAAEVETVLGRVRERGLSATRLRVSHAFHSPLVEAAAPKLAEVLASLPVREAVRPVASTVTGSLLGRGEDPRGLLVRQVTAPVRFAEALAAARGLADLWIEVGPGHALADLAAESLDAPILSLDAGGPSLAGVLKAAGAAFATGVPIDTATLFEGRFTRPFDPDRPLRFLENPCEAAPADALTPRPPLPRGEGEKEQFPAVSPSPLGRGGQGVRALLRHLVASRAELPPEAVRDDSRLLSDLHLNSISVGQLVVEAARQLGLQPPASPTDYAHATLAEVAEALERQAAAPTVSETPGAPAGVDSWVRAFTVELVPRDLPRRRPASARPGAWRVVAPADHPLREALSEILTNVPGTGLALCLPPDLREPPVSLLLETAHAALQSPPDRFVLVQQGGGGGSFARTLHLEMPHVTTCVVDVPFDAPGAAAWVAEEAFAAQGHAEAVYDSAGRRRVPVLRLLPPADGPGSLPLGPRDVLLVTGGGKGIAAECALDLARGAGARLALLGRSSPESDAELAANLERMRQAGVSLTYAAADVTDAAAVRNAVERIQAELGPVTAVLHGAGINAPKLLGSIEQAAFVRTLAPKICGIENVMAAVDPGRLRLLVTFGSIIARTGLRGEGDYAIANEWLALLTERFAQEHPDCRCLTLEWSVWAGVGMGERLGVLESLIRQGIAPIPPDAGIAVLRELLSRPLPSSSVVVTGRFGDPPTLEVERPELPLLRFLEKPRAFYPGVELVADAEISADTDPYLADHVYRGEPLFAAVLGLEAMAQAAMALTGAKNLPVFEEVELRRPIAVPPGRSVTVRVAALVREPGCVEVVLRESSTAFQADCFRAVCRFAPAKERQEARLHLSAEPEPAGLSLDPAIDLYGGVLFHKGRFRRLRSYRRLRATECLAEIAPDGAVPWFGRWLPNDLLLGDPGARDAAIHGIQACIPHATLLPTGVDRVVSGRIENNAALTFAARERSRNGDDFVYDVEILGPDGEVRERWEGLRLRAIDRVSPPPSWRAGLLATHVERRLQEILPGSGLRVALEAGGDSGPTVSRLLGGNGALRHRPDGKPEARVSVSHAGGLVFAVTGEGRIGCDLEPVAARPEQVWRDLLGEERFHLAELIAGERGEDRDAAATRVWAATEGLKKAGAPHGAPLLLESLEAPEGEGRGDGWLLLRSGRLRIGSLLAPVRELGGPAALAVVLETAETGLAGL